MSRLHVLVIDDSDVDLQLLTAAFDLCPEVRLTGFTQAVEALAWIQGQGERGRLPDLVVLDLQMPGMGGVEWLLEVQQSPTLQGVPVLLYSALPPAYQERCVPLGQVCGHWQKPMSLVEIEAQAQTLCWVWAQDCQFTSENLELGA